MYTIMVHILVSGGAGFLGSHLCKTLIELGHSVVCVDNLYTGREKNIEELRGHLNFEFILHDVTQPIHADVEGIFNLACPASPVHYQRDPVQTIKTSVLGSINLLDLAKKTNSRILQASTSEVYGDPKRNPQSEDYWGNVNPVGPRSCYDEGKRAAETLFVDYRMQYGVDTKIARIFNTYGPNMSVGDGRVVSNFIVQSLRGESLTLFGDGSQIRSFCYVDDLIDGLIELFFSDQNGPINFGNPEPISMAKLGEQIISLTESKSEIVYLPLPLNDPMLREPDITLAKDSLGWYPKIGREVGLKKTIDYFRRTLIDAGLL
jgi:UDP-glucuronate decarboxylase